MIEKQLLWDMIRRSPGEFVKSDGTFHIASITLSDAKIVNFFLGEDEACIAWFATETEAWSELEPALDALVARLRKMPPGVLESVKYWYSDTCCHYCKDSDPIKLQEKLSKHILVSKFPGIERCPYRDSFHATKIITESCQRGISSGTYLQFCTDAGRVYATPHEPDVQHLARLLYHKAQTNDDMDVTMAASVEKARDDSYYSQSVRTVQREPRPMANALADLFTTYKQISDNTPDTDYHWEVKQGKYRRGTAAIFKQEMQCVLNGCMSAPHGLTLPDDTHRLIETKPQLPKRPVFKSKIGSSGNEKLHQLMNDFLHGISRIGIDKVQCRIQLRLTIRNRTIDIMNNRVDDLGGFSFEAYFLNALCLDHIEEPLYPMTAHGANAMAAVNPADTSQPYAMPMLPMGDVSHEVFGWLYYDQQRTVARQHQEDGSHALALISTVDATNISLVQTGPVTTHRLPAAHVTGLARMPAVDLSNDDETELAIQCMAKVHRDSGGAAMSANEFHTQCADAYFEECLKNERLPVAQRKQLRGRVEPKAFVELNIGAGNNISKRKVKASRKRTHDAKMPAKKPRKVQKSRTDAAAAIHLGRTVKRVGAGRIRFVEGGADETNKDITCIEMLRAYVSNIKASTMIAVAPGSRLNKIADIQQQTAQLEKYFEAAGTTTFTPSCKCDVCAGS